MEPGLDEEAASLFEGMDFMDPLAEEDSPTVRAPGDDPPATSVSAKTASQPVTIEEPAEDSENAGLHPPPPPHAPVESSDSVSSGDFRLSEPLDERLFSNLSLSASAAESTEENAGAEFDAASGDPPSISPSTSFGKPGFLRESSSESIASEEANPRGLAPSHSGNSTHSNHLEGKGNSAFVPNPVLANVQRKKKRSVRIGYGREADEAGNHGGPALAHSESQGKSRNSNGSIPAEVYSHPEQQEASRAPNNSVHSMKNSNAAVDDDHHHHDHERLNSVGVESEEVANTDGKRIARDEKVLGKEKQTANGIDDVHEGDVVEGKNHPQPKKSSFKVENDEDNRDSDATGGRREQATKDELAEGQEIEKEKQEIQEKDPTSAQAKEIERDASSADEVKNDETEKDLEEVNNTEGKPNESKEPELNGKEEDLDPEIEVVDLEKLSLDELVQHVKKRFDFEMKRIESEMAKLNEERKRGVQSRREAKKKQSSFLQEIKEKEKELNSACEKEDFECADRLSQELEAIEEEIKKIDSDMKIAEELCDSCSVKIQEYQKREVEIMGTQHLALKNIQQKALEEAKSLKEVAEKQCSEKLESLAVSEEAISAKRRKIVLEQRVLDEERTELDAKVSQFTKTDREEKESLIKQRDVLTAELEELMEKVRQKEQQIKDCDDQISAVDSKIEGASSKFDRIIKELSAEEERIKASLLEMDAEQEKMEEEKKKIELELEHANSEGARLTELGQLAMKEGEEMEQAVTSKSEALSIDADRRLRKKTLSEKEALIANEISSLRLMADSIRSELQELTSQRIKFQQEIASTEQHISLAQKRLPELESEKKLAASARNFKEAARIASEAKSLLNDREAATARLAELQESARKLEADEEQKADLASEYESKLGELEREASHSRWEILKLAAVEIRREIENAVEIEDYEEADHLNLEVEGLEEEIRALENSLELQQDHSGGAEQVESKP